MAFGFFPPSIHSDAQACRSACIPYLPTSRMTGSPALLMIRSPKSFSAGWRAVAQGAPDAAFPGGGAGNDRLQFRFGRNHRTRVIPFRQIQFQSLGRRESRETTTARFLENRTE